VLVNTITLKVERNLAVKCFGKGSEYLFPEGGMGAQTECGAPDNRKSHDIHSQQEVEKEELEEKEFKQAEEGDREYVSATRHDNDQRPSLTSINSSADCNFSKTSPRVPEPTARTCSSNIDNEARPIPASAFINNRSPILTDGRHL
jgi:hypothetical protein